MVTIPVNHNISLAPFNTFHIDVNTLYFIEINSITELLHVVGERMLLDEPLLILGEGSNILFTGDFEGIVLKNNIKGIEISGEDENNVWIKAASGELWHELVLFSVLNNYGGIENLSLIPGTVGASPIQNIGAYGVELVDTFFELEALDLKTGEIIVFKKNDCDFGYRNSIFKNELKGKYYISSVTLKLNKDPKVNISYGAIKDILIKNGIKDPGIAAVSKAVIEIRKSKLPDPDLIGNAGSFFKNPEISDEQYQILKQKFENIPGYKINELLIKVPAGWLIEQCGWKGKRVGNTGAHKDQALVLVNYGNATGKEIYSLALEIKRSVMDKFGIEINPEVNVI